MDLHSDPRISFFFFMRTVGENQTIKKQVLASPHPAPIFILHAELQSQPNTAEGDENSVPGMT